MLAQLPHSYPFRLIDRVITISAKEGVFLKKVSFNEEFFQGHFSGDPVMPGVLIVEAMAQASGLVLNHSKPEAALAYLAKIVEVKFSSSVTPGDSLTIEARLTHELGTMANFSVTASVGERVAATGELVMVSGPSEAS